MDTKLYCELESLSSRPSVPLPKNQEIIIGRTKDCGIESGDISRVQLTAKADYQMQRVCVIVKGKALSTCNGFKLQKHKKYYLKHGDTLGINWSQFHYKIAFKNSLELTKTNHLSGSSFSIFPQPPSSKKEPTPTTSTSSSGSSTEATTTTTSVESNESAYSEFDANPTFYWVNVDNGDLLIYCPNLNRPSQKIAAFDIDGTIITTRTGSRFPVDLYDWKILYPIISLRLKHLLDDGYKLAFFTNQSTLYRNTKRINEFKSKIGDIVKKLRLPILVFVATGKSLYRKPCTAMWQALEGLKNDKVPIDKTQSFYVGDAAGREKNWAPNKKRDHSLCDRLFALNVGIKFYTPEEFFLKSSPAKYNMPDFDPRNIPSGQIIPLSNSQEVIIMVGSPASGKTHYSKSYIQSRGYAYINQDTLGSFEKCVKSFLEALKLKRSVVVDNTNQTIQVRKTYLEYAKRYGVPCRCFKMNTSIKQCFHNNKFRSFTDKWHKLVTDPIIYSYWNKLEEPTKDEGFVDVVKVDFVPNFKNESEELLYKMFLLEN